MNLPVKYISYSEPHFTDAFETGPCCDRCGEVLDGEIAEIADEHDAILIVHVGCMKQSDSIA